MVDESEPAPGAAGSAPPADELRVLPLSLIDVRSDQPRRASRGKALQGLVRSVVEVGVLQPIRVRRAGERYEIVAGQRRWAAARAVGLTEIPAVVVDRDDDAALVEALIENVQREDLSLADRADAIRRVRAVLGLRSWEDVGRRLGVSRGHLHRLLAITRLPDEMREHPIFASLTEKHVRALRRLRERPVAQWHLWEAISSEAMSGEQAIVAAAALLADRPATAVGHPSVDVVRAAAGGLLEAIELLDDQSLSAVRDELWRVSQSLAALLGREGLSA